MRIIVPAREVAPGIWEVTSLKPRARRKPRPFLSAYEIAALVVATFITVTSLLMQ